MDGKPWASVRIGFHAAGRFVVLVGLVPLIVLVPLTGGALTTAQEPTDSKPSPRALTALPPELELDAGQVELGKRLFFDGRLSGDGTIRCATCHAPDKAWTDGLPLSRGYPGTLYFRNTPTIANVAHARLVYWDGRLPASDLPTVVRDHIAEAHFMQADGRLVIERMRQVPEYSVQFDKVFGGEPTYGRILSAVSEFVKSVRSQDVPFDAYLAGDEDKLSEAAQRGLELFRGKAGCIQCHDGALLSDGRFHNLGLPDTSDIFRTPLRHITFRRFMRTLGVSNYANIRSDVGLFAVTKQPADRGRFRTPTLREVSRTAPYMHDGSLATLEDVVAFYNRGGGDNGGGDNGGGDNGGGGAKDALLKPLGLSAEEQAALVEFLKALAGKSLAIDPVEPPPYGLRTIGDN